MPADVFSIACTARPLWIRKTHVCFWFWMAALLSMCSVKRKLVSQALRFVAHHHGASLVFASTREKPLRDQVPLLPL